MQGDRRMLRRDARLAEAGSPTKAQLWLAGIGFSGHPDCNIQPPPRNSAAPAVLRRRRLGLVPASLQSGLASLPPHHSGWLPPDVTATGGGCDAAFSNAMGSSDHEPCRRCRSGSPRNGAAFPALHALGTATGAHVNEWDLHCYPKRTRGPYCSDECHVAPGSTTSAARVLCSTLRLARAGIRPYFICDRFGQRALLHTFAACCGGLLLDAPATLDPVAIGHYVVGR